MTVSPTARWRAPRRGGARHSSGSNGGARRARFKSPASVPAAAATMPATAAAANMCPRVLPLLREQGRLRALPCQWATGVHVPLGSASWQPRHPCPLRLAHLAAAAAADDVPGPAPDALRRGAARLQGRLL